MDRSPGRTRPRRYAQRPRWPPTSRPSTAPRSRVRLRLAFPVLVVFVEALARLHTQVPGEHHALQERRRCPRGVAELVEERVRDVQIDVEPGVVDELERPHRVAQAELHG